MQAQLMASMGMEAGAEGHDAGDHDVVDVVEVQENKAPKKPAT
jgi:hypothetical protein